MENNTNGSFKRLNLDKQVAKPYHDIGTPFSVDNQGAYAEYIIHDPDNMKDLGLGATVVIWDYDFIQHRNLWIAGQVIGLRAISPFNPQRESMLYQKDDTFNEVYHQLEEVNGPHTHQPMIIKVELSRVMTQTDGITNLAHFSVSPVQKPPSGVSRLFFPDVKSSSSIVDRPPSLEEILNIKTNGIVLGMIGFGNTPYEIENEFLEYRWDIDRLDNKHIFIVGESGSGKTVFLKNLAYQVRKNGQVNSEQNRVILTDVQGDISQILLWDMQNILQPRLAWQERVVQDNQEKAKEYFEDFQLLVPMTKDGVPGDVQNLMDLAERRGVKVELLSLRMEDLQTPGEVDFLFRTNSEQVPMLLEDISEGLRTNSQIRTITRYEMAINNLLNGNNNPQIIMPTSGIGYYRSTFEAARRALRSLRDYFDLDQAVLGKPENPLDKLRFQGTTIFYLDHLNQEEKFMWEMQLVKWLYHNKKDMSNTFVFIDEAHQIIPAKPVAFGNKEVFERLRSNFEKLAREGRKFRLNLILSTQSPTDLHAIVPEQCPTKIIMKINPNNAKAATLDQHLANIASSFTQGQFWIQSPFNGTPDWVRVHSAAPPVPHEPMNTFRGKIENQAEKEILKG